MRYRAMTIGTLAVTAALTLLSANDTDPNDTSWSSDRTATLDHTATTQQFVTSAAADSTNTVAGAPDTSWAGPVLD
ncbi:MAG: hypothetical protein HOV83_27840 [Catenulispora sp.]|nr:hypothetical protein [Catenulispora sp.]